MSPDLKHTLSPWPLMEIRRDNAPSMRMGGKSSDCEMKIYQRGRWDGGYHRVRREWINGALCLSRRKSFGHDKKPSVKLYSTTYADGLPMQLTWRKWWRRVDNEFDDDGGRVGDSRGLEEEEALSDSVWADKAPSRSEVMTNRVENICRSRHILRSYPHFWIPVLLFFPETVTLFSVANVINHSFHQSFHP